MKFTSLFQGVLRGLAAAALASLLSAQAFGLTLQMSNDSKSITYQLTFEGAPTYKRIFFDTDRLESTGYVGNGIGAEYMLENGRLYKFTGGSQIAWSWDLIKVLDNNVVANTMVWVVSRKDIGFPGGVDLVGQVDSPPSGPSAVTGKISQVFVLSPPVASSDALSVSYKIEMPTEPTFARVFLDTDKTSTTGYKFGGIGADYLIENWSLYRYTGSGQDWSWSRVGPTRYVQYQPSAGGVVLGVSRADLNNPQSLTFVTQSKEPLNTSLPIGQSLVSATPGALNFVIYSPASGVVANPERGFYKSNVACDRDVFNRSVLEGYRENNGQTIVLCGFSLKNFKQAPINTATLSFFQTQMDLIRAAGLKAAVRFSYTESTTGDDASLTRVMQHMDQLKPLFANNSDVIFVAQTGWIGAWGEAAFSQNFGNGGFLTAQNIADRKTLVEKFLQVLPANRMTQARTPGQKMSFFGPAPLQDSEAFSGASKARVGHFNDCFLRSPTDSGTYTNLLSDYQYLESETKFLPMGGETCGTSSDHSGPQPSGGYRDGCLTALMEMQRFHWSYLNFDFHSGVLNGWRSQGCFQQIGDKLGYRFVLQDGIYSNTATPGGSMSISINIKNDGWATPFNQRSAYLVLKNYSTGAITKILLNTDPRLWSPGIVTSVNQSISLPSNLPPGSYALFLSLPDVSPSLSGRPEYSIRFANESVWDGATGLNDLGHILTLAN